MAPPLPVPPRPLVGRGEGTVVNQSDDTRKTWNGSGSAIVRSCGHCVLSKGSGDTTGHGSVSGIDWENKSKNGILTWIWSGSKGSG